MGCPIVLSVVAVDLPPQVVRINVEGLVHDFGSSLPFFEKPSVGLRGPTMTKLCFDFRAVDPAPNWRKDPSTSAMSQSPEKGHGGGDVLPSQAETDPATWVDHGTSSLAVRLY